VIVGVVGAEQAKFTSRTEALCRELIHYELTRAKAHLVVSGACHLGGVDAYARDIAAEMRLPFVAYPPAKLRWEGGYKQRNVKIAEAADLTLCFTLRELPPEFMGLRHRFCYHCGTRDHVKSGGCWTVKMARKLGKAGRIVVVD